MNQEVLKNKKTILFWDQDTELIQILSSFLVLNGFRSLQCSSLREVIQKAANQKFEFIFIDPLSFEDCYEDFIEKCRDPNHINRTTEIVLMTRNLNCELDSRLVSTIRCVLQKPFELEHFIGAIGLEPHISNPKSPQGGTS